ncbi:MAG: M15 family metallopeptidase [Synechococcus sp.]
MGEFVSVVPFKPYHSIPISECNESLQELPPCFLTLQPHPYVAVGADYAGTSPFVLRQTIVAKLNAAQQLIRQQKPGWTLLVFDAFRPITVQRYMVDYTYRQLLSDRNLQPETVTPQQRKAVMEEVLKFWALPSDDPATPPPHSTGAAIDLTLADEQGNEINMGSPIDEISERSYPYHFQGSRMPEEQQFHDHRSILFGAMESAGFIGHPNEWWHFSYGDQIWAWQLGERFGETKDAIYGAVAINTQEHTAELEASL